MKKVYLAGQFNEYDDWKTSFKNVDGFDFFDPETDSDQASPDTFFPQDLYAISDADILIANPGLAPSEGSWIEIGYFLARNTKKPGDICENLIIIWNEERKNWSIDFVQKAGHVVHTVDEAVKKLKEIKNNNQ